MPPSPAKTAFPTGMVSGPKIIFTVRANMYPRRAPPNNDGANIPATPPAPTVNPVKMGFKAQASKRAAIMAKPSTFLKGLNS